MFKISSRKGLGIGAVVALATTLFAGAPAAQAAASLTLTPTYTGTNTVLTGGGFSLTTISGGGHMNGSNNLEYMVKNNSAVSVDVTEFANAGSQTKTIAAGDSEYFTRTAIGNNDETEEVFFAAQPSSGWGSVDLSVKAWVDENPGNDAIDAGEAVSEAVAIKYVDGREYTATTKFEAAAAGDTSILADVTFAGTSELNLAQVAAAITAGADTNASDVVKVDIYKDAVSLGTAGSVTYDATAKALVFEYTTAVSAGVYEARTYYFDYKSSVADYITWASTAYTEVLANVITAVDPAVGTEGANVNVDSSDDTIVRAGTTSVEYTAALYQADGSDTDSNPDAAPANVPVSVTFAADFASYGSSFKVGDKTVSSTSPSATVKLVTDSAGEVKFTISSATAEAGDTVDITVTSQGVSATSTTSWESATYKVKAVPTDGGSDPTDVSVAVGGTANLQFKVVDQWHVAPTGAYQLLITRAANVARDTAASWGYTATVSNGLATAAVVDNGAGYGSDTVTAQLQKQQTGGAWTNVTTGSPSTTLVLHYTSAALLVATKVTATPDDDGSTTALPLSDLTDFVAFDTRLGDANWAGDHATLSEGTYITGTVTTATGAPVKYAPVTVSLAGAVLSTGNTVFVGAKDSLTVLTDSNGHYLVWVFTNKPGTQTVSIKAGAASEDVDLVFANSTPKTITVVANGGAASSQTGRTIQVSATVKDANGFGVPDQTVTFSSVGAGVYAASSATTDANGVATVSYAVGAADTGSVDFTAKVGTKTATKVTVTFVRSTGNVTHNKKGTVTAKWSYAKGQNILVVVDGYRRYSQVELSDAANSFSKHLKKGRHVVNLYIGGVLIDSLKFTVKK